MPTSWMDGPLQSVRRQFLTHPTFIILLKSLDFCQPYITEPLNHEQIISSNLNLKRNPFYYIAYTVAFGCWAWAHGNGGTFGRQLLTHPNFIILLKAPDFCYLIVKIKPYTTEPLNHDQIISNNLNLKRNPFCYRTYTIAFGCWTWAHGNGGIFGRQVQGLSLWQNKRWQHFDAHSCPERTSRYCNGPFQKGRVIYPKYYKHVTTRGHLQLVVDV